MKTAADQDYPVPMLDEIGAQIMAARLQHFFSKHDPLKMSDVHGIIATFKDRPDDLKRCGRTQDEFVLVFCHRLFEVSCRASFLLSKVREFLLGGCEKLMATNSKIPKGCFRYVSCTSGTS